MSLNVFSIVMIASMAFSPSLQTQEPTPSEFLIVGSRVVPTGSTTVFEFSISGEFPERDVNWSVLEKAGGSVTAGGIYRAPKKPGKYTLRAFSKNAPGKLGQAKIEVRETKDIGIAWEISQFMRNGQCFPITMSFVDPHQGWTPHESYKAVFDMEFEGNNGDIIKTKAYAYPTPDTDFEREAKLHAVVENQDLSSIVFERLRDKEGKVLCESRIDNTPLPDLEYEMVQNSDGTFRARAPKMPSGFETGFYSVEVSWDEGKSWTSMYRECGKGPGWGKVIIPKSGLLEVPDPLIRFRHQRGFQVKDKVYKLRGILASTNKS